MVRSLSFLTRSPTPMLVTSTVATCIPTNTALFAKPGSTCPVVADGSRCGATVGPTNGLNRLVDASSGRHARRLVAPTAAREIVTVVAASR